MKRIAAETRINSEIVKSLYDETFIENINYTILISDPVCKIINQCQSQNYNIADASEDWLKLEIPKQYNENFSKRQKMVLTQYSLTANLLHPQYKGKRLSNEQMDIADKYAFNYLESDGITSLQQYIHNEVIFSELNEKVFFL